MSKGSWVLLATILASSLVFVDGAVVSIALPVMQVQLHASTSEAQWVVEGYTLVLGSLTLLSGALADRLGRKRLFLAGVALFACASLWVGLSTSIGMLLLARVVQGLGGTMLAPASLALLGAHFQGEERGKAVGTWSALTSLASTIGPVLGGVIVDHFSWRWVFAINLPLALIVFVAAMKHVDESRDEGVSGRLDFLGSALITAALGLVVYSFILAQTLGWHDAEVLGTMAAGCAAFALFYLTERTVRNPILPLALFAGKTFAGVNVLTLLLYAALGGLFYFLPFVLIRVDRYSATRAGLALLPFVVLMVLLSRKSGALTYRFGAKLLLTAGPLLAAGGFLLFVWLPGSEYWTAVFPGQVLIGAGMGLAVAPLTTTMLESVAERHVGLASGINSAIARIAGLLAIAVLGLLLTSVFNQRLDRRMNDARLSAAEQTLVNAQRPYLAGATLAQPRLEELVLHSYDDGFRVVALACALLAAAGGLVSALLIEKKPVPVDA